MKKLYWRASNFSVLYALAIASLALCGCGEQKPKEEFMQENSENEKKIEATIVTIQTNFGDIKVRLDSERAPITVKNFLSYVESGHYSNTIFHRVIPGFMIQGGGFTKEMKQKPTQQPIKNEAANGLKNEIGTIAMARTADVDSASSQFFINVADNYFLDHVSSSPREFGYCVFGKVISGMDIVQKISTVPTGNQMAFQNVPTEAVEIVSVTLSQD